MERTSGTDRSKTARADGDAKAAAFPVTASKQRPAKAGTTRLTSALIGALASLVVLAATPALAETRTLDLYYTHTRERLTITFKKDGRYIPSALKQLNHFLRDWRRNEPTNMDPRLFDTVWELYQKSGSRQPVHIVSAYRSPATNNMLRSRSKAVAKHSQHTLGKAMDFFLPDVPLNKLRAIGMQMQRGGVGWYPRSNSPFIHIDVGSVRAWPRMTRAQLVKLFPDGKTVHLPADGKPLAGYQQALAEIKRKGGSSSSLAMAEETTRKRGGLLAMLFGDEEDDVAEAESAGGLKTTGQSLTKPTEAAEPAPAKVRTKPVEAPPAAVAAPAPAPTKAKPAPAEPETLPFAVASAAEPAPAPAAPPPVPSAKPAELLAAAELQVAMLQAPVLPRAKPALPPAEAGAGAPGLDEVRPTLPAIGAVAAVAELAAARRPDEAAPAQPQTAAGALAAVAGTAEDAPALAYASDLPIAPRPETAAPPRTLPKLAYAAATSAPASLSDGITGTAPLRPLAQPPGSNAHRTDLHTGEGSDLAEKSDQLATLTTIFPPADLPVFDPDQSVAGRSFAVLVHPDQMRDVILFQAPTTVLKAGFADAERDGLSAARFSGSAVARLVTVRFPTRQTVALR